MTENKNLFTGKRAIVVDDDHDLVDTFKTYLVDFGFSVVTGHSHDEGGRYIMEEEYDLAIFGLMMDKADSGFILSYLSKKQNPSATVLIVTSVTASTGIRFDNYNKEKCAWVKADEVLDKNTRPEQLERILEKYLD